MYRIPCFRARILVTSRRKHPQLLVWPKRSRPPLMDSLLPQSQMQFQYVLPFLTLSKLLTSQRPNLFPLNSSLGGHIALHANTELFSFLFDMFPYTFYGNNLGRKHRQCSTRIGNIVEQNYVTARPKVFLNAEKFAARFDKHQLNWSQIVHRKPF